MILYYLELKTKKIIFLCRKSTYQLWTMFKVTFTKIEKTKNR